MPPLDRGIYIVMGEMNTIVTAMRRGNRWGSHGPQDDDQDCLLRSFSNLREVLSHVQELQELEPNVFLTPFLDMIRSQDTTGPVTGLALSSVNKFLSYDMIDARCETALSAVEHIADAVTHARFVGTDPASDEVVLMKILQVLRTLLLTSAGLLLTNESVCEIMQSCFRICFETRLSELLRKEAEHALVDMVQLLFCRLPTFTEDTKYVSMRKLKMKAGGIDTTRTTKKRRSPRPKKPSPTSATTPTSSASAILVKEEESPILSSDPIPVQGISTPATNSLANSVESEVSESRSSREPSEPPAHESTCIDMSGTINTSLPADGEMISSLQDLSYSSQTVDSVNGFENCLGMSESTTDLRRSWEAVDNCVNTSSIVNDEESSGVTTSECPDMSLMKEEDYINPRGVRFTPQQVPTEGTGPLIPYGLPCVRELFRFLLSLINPLDKQNTEVMTHIGLSLLTVSLECGADHIGSFNCLLSLVKDEMCRNLFSLLHSDRISIFSSSLRVCFLLFESLRTHLKFQLEMFLTRLMDIIVSESPRISYEQREIALDSVVQLWRIPGLVTELYLNYDCDLYCTNLFEDLTKMLSKNAFPVSGLYSTHLLSLDTLLTVIESIESHCHVRMLYESQVESNVNQQSGDISNTVQDRSKLGCEPTPVTCALPSLQPSGFILNKSLEQNGHGPSPVKATLAAQPRRVPHIKANRMKPTGPVPSHEELMAIKNKKKLLAAGSEHFKTKPAKGITFLQEHNLLTDPLNPTEVATFLRDNPKLDKHMIGEYISNRKNLKILEAFIRSFNFEDIRIDEALRMYLETFRLPGEAPLISLLMEHFAEHWHRSNGEPFANSDAAFTLAYAIIMLNVDQHNHNVKKQNIPMTLEEFKKNLKNVNGSQDFDGEMLEEIFTAIKNEEIVMPAEQTGLVKENYLWKVLLRRGKDKEGVFLHAPNGLLDRDLFSLCWGPTVAALSFVFDKSSDGTVIQKAIAGFRKCAMISAHYGMSDVFDNLVISLCKYTTFLSSSETPESLPMSFGSNGKAQLAARTVFNLAHRHGDILREGWRNLLECILQLFRAKMLPREMIEAEDFLAPKGYVVLIRDEIPALTPRMESGLFSSFYSYITLTADSQAQKLPTPEEEAAKQAALDCISQCMPEQLITESKFLRLDSLQELSKALIYQGHCPDQSPGPDLTYDEDCAVFMLEMLVKVVLQNRDRASFIWPTVQSHFYKLMMTSASNECSYLLERTVVGMLRISIRMLRKEELAPEVLDSLNRMLHLRSSHLYQVSRQVSYALFELLRTSAANIHSEQEWSTLFTLLECVGAGAKPPQHVWSSSISCNSQDTCDTASDSGAQSDSELSRHTQDSGLSTDRGYTSDSELYEGAPGGKHMHHHHHHHRGSVDSMSSGSGWILVGREGEIEQVQVRPLPVNQYNIILEREMQAHDPHAFTKSCETLAFLVRDVTHITPQNFQSCIHCIRTFVEASLNGGISFQKRRQGPGKEAVKDRRSNRLPLKREKDSRMKRSKSSPTHISLGYESDNEDAAPDLPPAYQEASIQLLDFMHTLYTRAAHIFGSWAAETNREFDLKPSLWLTCWCPLLQGIARLCCDKRRSVRTSALTYLQRALLNHDLQVLSAIEWEACFNQVLFPLLAKLLENINSQDRVGMEETRVRVATLLCKVFLQHLNPLLSLSTFTALWLTILDFMDKYMHSDSNDLLSEAIPESLKNMLLVMDTAGIFQQPSEGQTDKLEEQQLWHITWDRINLFLPGLRDEVFKKPVLSMPPQPQPQPPVQLPAQQANIIADVPSTIIPVAETEVEPEPVVAPAVPPNEEHSPSETTSSPLHMSFPPAHIPSTASTVTAVAATPPLVAPSLCATPTRSSSLSMVLPPAVSISNSVIVSPLPSSSVILHPPTAPAPCNILISQQQMPAPLGMNVTGPPLPLILDPAIVGSAAVPTIFSQSTSSKCVLPR